jgi:transposase
MSTIPLFVGVDYHQDQLQICVMDQQAAVHLNSSHANDAPAVAKLLQGMGSVHSVAIEACCGAADFGQELAAAGSFRVELAHSGYVARLKQSPDKTDYGDARLLADLTRVGYLPRVWLAPPAVRDLRQLTNHRQRLVNGRRAVKLQVGAILREQRVKLAGGRWGKQWTAQARDNVQLSDSARWIVNDLLDEILHLDNKTHRVASRLREVTADNPLIGQLRRIEGVGEVTAWMLSAWIGRFDRFKNGKQLSRYCGLSPRNASSGKRQADAGLMDAANKPLRAVLIQAAHRLIRTNDRWGKLAERLANKGKPTCVVVAAVANRWVRSMHHRMLQPQQPAAKEQENLEKEAEEA